MIKITDKSQCCGCSACVQKCPKQCITMNVDNEGFSYPKVDLDCCIDCNLCEKVCPCLNQEESQQPLSCYAAKNKDEEIRQQSSSGGIFTAIAENIIAEKGVVFGARYNNNWQVVHTYVETKQGIAAFRGSKYVQSQIGETFKQAESFLKEGRKVLYSGTPCQISGLNHYLRKQYDNLLTVEVVCHGVPSPKVWLKYLESLQLTNIGSISHKDKTTGWRDYSFTIKDRDGNTLFTENAGENKYLIAFGRNLTLRPSCFSCPSKAGRSRADISLADYWGIEKLQPQIDDNKGVSFVCVYTDKGDSFIKKLNLLLMDADYKLSVAYNPCIYRNTIEPVDRQSFLENYKQQGINALLLLKQKRRNLLIRILKKILR